MDMFSKIVQARVIVCQFFVVTFGDKIPIILLAMRQNICLCKSNCEVLPMIC